MSTQFFLDEKDIEILAKLMLRSQQLRTREALCLRIGIDHRRLWFIKDYSDSDFIIQLITHLNEIDNKEAICKLCYQELWPIFCNSEIYAPILIEIATKINCNQEFRQNYPNPSAIEQPTSPTPSPVPEIEINPSLQPDTPKSQSWFTKISHVNKKLLRNGVIIIMGGVVAVYSLSKWFSNCAPISSSDVAIASKALSKIDSPGYIVSDLRKSSSSSSSYLCLGTQGGKSDNGTAIIIWDCNRNPDQSWTYTYGQLKGVGGKCISAEGGSVKNATAIIIWDCNRNPDQSWTYTSYGQLKGVGGKCIDAPNSSVENGTPIILWKCNGNPNQSWR
jgi:hypothetical protein